MSSTQGPPAPAEEAKTIPLPPVPRAAPRPRRPWGDHVLAALVLAVAFLAASSVARNSNLWFHLATGRMIAGGQFPFGADPFASTTGGVYWACHSWLFDLGLYELFERVGGAGLVVLKALLVTALAGLLLLVRRPGSRAWIPVVCTTLAVAAMSPRLLVQPACASYFFLGLTFWLLWAQHEGERPNLCRAALLLALVAWVNVDEWFLLGPALVGLVWLGERMEGQRRTPGWLLLGSILVCLINPYTVHAFALPSELSPVTWSGGLRDDARFRALFASPWSGDHLKAAVHHPPALAYYSLALLGLASFLLNRRAPRGWRLAVWLPFAALAAWQARAIPFFAHLVQRSPALPLLAVAADPKDADAWLRLGQAYAQLRLATGEGSARGLLPPLANLRHVRIATALEQALRLNPILGAARGGPPGEAVPFSGAPIVGLYLEKLGESRPAQGHP